MADEIVDRHVGTGPSALVDRRVARDPEKERDERKPAIFVPVEGFHRAYEHVGYQVLRLVFRAGPRQAVPIDRVAIALVELTEGGGIAGLGGFDERGVDTALLCSSCRLTGDAGVLDDLRAPGHLVGERR
jgi:hypothetical protein